MLLSPKAAPAVVTEGEGIPIVGLPQVAAAVILVSAVLLGAICIVRKRHKVSSARYVWVT